VIAGSQWIVAVAIFLLVGGAATWYIRTVVQRRDEAAAGINALSAMSWREFIHLVLKSLARRGYERVNGDELPSRDGEYLLLRDGERWLMSCKHGSAFVLGAPAVSELADDLKLSSATGGLLVTQGRVADDARGLAKLRHVVLLDGPTLWPQVRDTLPAERMSLIRREAHRRSRPYLLASWLAGAVAGMAALMLLPASDPLEPASRVTHASPMSAAPATVSSAIADTAVAGRAAPPSSTPAAPPPAPAASALDEATLDQQRKDVASAISTLPMVDRATWPSRSTMEVFLLDTSADAFAMICPLMERYPALVASRIQLTPPHGSEMPVRFRQCQAY
jgi:restriction system protein